MERWKALGWQPVTSSFPSNVACNRRVHNATTSLLLEGKSCARGAQAWSLIKDTLNNTQPIHSLPLPSHILQFFLCLFLPGVEQIHSCSPPNHTLCFVLVFCYTLCPPF